jgi:hypothetical protein
MTQNPREKLPDATKFESLFPYRMMSHRRQ